jgi:hypothetical protein
VAAAQGPGRRGSGGSGSAPAPARAGQCGGVAGAGRWSRGRARGGGGWACLVPAPSEAGRAQGAGHCVWAQGCFDHVGVFFFLKTFRESQHHALGEGASSPSDSVPALGEGSLPRVPTKTLGELFFIFYFLPHFFVRHSHII